MQIHEALFQANYQHGYILKPQTLLPVSHPPSSHHPTPYESKPCRVKLDIHVISGQQLPRPKDYKLGQTVDPYVQIELICPNGQISEGRTRPVRDNEFNPMWDERLSCEMTTPSREFVFVRYRSTPAKVTDERFSLHNGDKSAGSNLFASYCIRLQDLHQGNLSPASLYLCGGYRHVPLVDLQGEKYIYSTLFVKINWSMTETFVAERLSPAKLEKRSKMKARITRLDPDGSRSGTSIDSSGSSALSVSGDDSIRGDRRESVTGMTKINEDNEGRDVDFRSGKNTALYGVE